MEHESSILYAPVNALWHSVQQRFPWDIPDHVIMALLVLLISCLVFPLMSLGMRLFGNIFGEHAATGIFMGILPFVIPWPMMGLGIFGAFLQTFVFIMLTMVYIAGATVTEEH